MVERPETLRGKLQGFKTMHATRLLTPALNEFMKVDVLEVEVLMQLQEQVQVMGQTSVDGSPLDKDVAAGMLGVSTSVLEKSLAIWDLGKKDVVEAGLVLLQPMLNLLKAAPEHSVLSLARDHISSCCRLQAKVDEFEALGKDVDTCCKQDENHTKIKAIMSLSKKVNDEVGSLNTQWADKSFSVAVTHSAAVLLEGAKDSLIQQCKFLVDDIAQEHIDEGEPSLHDGCRALIPWPHTGLLHVAGASLSRS